MESMIRWLLALLVLLALACTGAYVVAGRGAPPHLTIDKPDRFVGQAGSVDVTADTPNAQLTTLTITLEQHGRRIPLFTLDGTQETGVTRVDRNLGRQGISVTRVDRNHLKLSLPLGKLSVPALQSGPARVVVSATRPSFLNLRQLTSTASKDFQVRLEPPRIAVLSTHHYVNHGGSEMVVYKATPADVASGVLVGSVEYPVGNVEYPGFPASGAGVEGADPSIKVAFFALLHDQRITTEIALFARDEAGNQTNVSFVDNVFEKPFKQSRIELDDTFINRVVPEILDHAPELKMTAPAQNSPEMLAAFLRVNGELRRINADQIAALARKTSPKRLWDGPFVQLGNSQVEASFADRRTYFYKGHEVDRQTHLGFDLAVTQHVPVASANSGTVLNASWLGIYGNCVIVDHGLGVQSLYGHLMSFEVKVGDTVARGQVIGRSDSTGLAGGDHLHFTLLVGGRMVTPVEWWDPHWIADRIERKLREAR